MTRGQAYRAARARGESIARALAIAQQYAADPIPDAGVVVRPWVDFADSEAGRIRNQDAYLEIISV